MKCIICGSWIPDGTMAVLKRQLGKSAYLVPREVCLACASEDKKRTPAKKIRIPDGCIDQALRLAGAISRSCLKLYKDQYVKAVEAVFKGAVLWDPPIHEPDDEHKDPLGDFLRYHKELYTKPALTLSLGMMPDLMAYTRRKESETWVGGMKRAARELEDMLEEACTSAD